MKDSVDSSVEWSFLLCECEKQEAGRMQSWEGDLKISRKALNVSVWGLRRGLHCVQRRRLSGGREANGFGLPW